ncbi:uncharacterized protein BDV14DRAFT_25287 [Aspergillus stella-maris]|uniref:uncharacterized protein n=1 Tax=Aspergillus stella-maris TaxID=1810926 RepID=UPI003CCD1FC0
MSSRSTDNSVRPPASTRGKSAYSEKNIIDQRLKRLREEVHPFYPFLLTVPTDVPFRLGNRFVNNWAVSNEGPFTQEEQQLQYMTFLTHDESDSLLVAVGDWSDATGSVMADSRSRPQSATSTPSSNSNKKKISLHDYKNKRKNGTSPPHLGRDTSSHQSASNLHVPYDNHASKPLPASDKHQKLPRPHFPPSPSAHSDFDHVDRKRPPERDHGRSGLQVKDSAPTKRRKLSPEPSTHRVKSEQSNGNGLPELLSPTLPPTSSTPRLPRLLSPTLPPDLEKELANLGNEPLAFDSQPESNPTSDTAKAKIQRDKLSAHRPSQLDSTAASISPNVHSKSPRMGPEKSSLNSAETPISTSQTILKASLQPRISSKPPQQSIAKPVQPVQSRLRLIVKLKYGRSNRRRVEGLLKFAGKRKLSRQSSPTPDATERESSFFTKTEHANKPVSADTKIKIESANFCTKDRAKEPRPAGTEKPPTPNLAQTQQEKARPVSLTPAKDLKQSSSRHDSASTEGRVHANPAPRKAPADSSLRATTQSPSQSSSMDRISERRAWKDEYQKYGNLGRELKHAADRHTAKEKVVSADEKLAAATAIEAIICFVLAFIADDQSKAVSRQVGDSSTWLSIIAYWRVVEKNSLRYSPLHSLCLILGAVSYDAIHALDLERLAVTPVPGEHTPVPTPASDGQPAHSDESKRGLKDFLELKTRLPECYKKSQRLWLDGSRGLSEDILARDFPETWSKRARNYSEQGKKKLKPGDYSGAIYLPIAKTSTPLEIIRFSCALLREWCAKENIDWRGKLDL